MMMSQPTQCDFEFPFGPPATQIERGKSAGAETMPKKTATLDARFCPLTVLNQARATSQIRLRLCLALGDALAPAQKIRKSTNL
jgi:hypothetical protein